MPDSMRQRIVFLQNPVHHRYKFFAFRAVHDVWILDADQRPVRRNHHHVQVINLSEFRRFRLCGTGHTGQLFVHAKIILEGNRR